MAWLLVVSDGITPWYKLTLPFFAARAIARILHGIPSGKDGYQVWYVHKREAYNLLILILGIEMLGSVASNTISAGR
jgi:hypothetical protein